ncbi:DNA repair protein REV1 [Genypterus blacodes]|uniref:DNA repair protein REV1 n=1 Tax=Genypterus blacodes TaxID=154954 RepID=UPI003F760560
MSRDGWAKKRASDDNGWAATGGYMAAKVSKLEEQFKLDAPREKHKQGAFTNIFSGVAIYVNGYTDPSADELRRLMMLHGGQFHVYFSRSKTTHIIANNLPNSKIQELKGEKVIRPEWITDSIKAGQLLPFLQYQLYVKQKGLTFPSVSVRPAPQTAGSSRSHGPPQQSLCPNLQLPQHSVLKREQSSSSPHVNSDPNPSTSHPPQSAQRSPDAGFVTPGQPVRPHSGPESRHCSPSHQPSPSSLRPPQPCVHDNKGGQTGAQSSAACNAIQSTHRELHLKINGSLQNSLDPMSHSRTNNAHGCGSEDAQLEVKDAPLTNGYTHLVNGALKSEDLAPGDKDPLPHCILKSSENKPASPPVRAPHSPKTKPDSYKFTPNRNQQSSSQSAREQRPLNPPPPSYQTVKTPDPQPTGQAASNPERTLLLPPSSLSHAPVRLNGSHHTASPSDPKANSSSAGPEPVADKTSSSKSSSQLQAQTSGLISEFYSHSRFHQISTWRSGFSEYVNELHSRRRREGPTSFPGRDRLRKCVAQYPADSQGTLTPVSVKSCILHVDMDCFFVSVGIRHRPELKGKPVAVTSNRGLGRVPLRPGANPQMEQQYYQRKRAQAERQEEDLNSSSSQDAPDSHANGVDHDASALSMAEIASCSYEARQAGVRNGMFFGKAKQLCPSLQAVPYDFEAYKDVALTMYETLASYTHDIEALSCDEVLIDSSSLLSELGIAPEDLAKAIRADIQERTGCSASVGMGSNILLARLATRKAKPDGHYFLKSEEVDDFIRDLSVNSLPGVGHVMSNKLAGMGVRSCGDLLQVSLSQLQKKFGPRTGQTLFRFCRGLDDRPVRYEKQRKSVSAEMNYNIRFTGVDEAESFLTNLSMEVQKRLQEAGLQGRRVTLKVMVRKVGAPVESAKYGGHGICDNLARTVMLAQSTDSGQLIASAVIKLFHAMKLQVQDLRGLGIQVQLLEGNHSANQESTGSSRTRNIRDMLLGQGLAATANSTAVSDIDAATAADTDSTNQEKASSIRVPSPAASPRPLWPAEAVPGTSKQQTPKRPRARLNISIEIPSPSQVDRSVLEALPAELREQVEQSWSCGAGRPNNRHAPSPQPSAPFPRPSSPQSHRASPPPPPPPQAASVSGVALRLQPIQTLVLQAPNQPESVNIVLELPNFSQVDPDVFAALPKELQEELRSAYSRMTNVQPQPKMPEQNNPLLQLKQSGVGISVGRVKRRYKRKNAVSPVKKTASPLKRRQTGQSPAKNQPPSIKPREVINGLKLEMGPSTDVPESPSKFIPRPAPALAGACDLMDIRTLLREWVTTITEPMEEDILQVVKYCTDLIEDKDLEKLDLIIKYMKRLMQQSVESVWSMAFDFILDNVQVVVHQAYGSTLKIT